MGWLVMAGAGLCWVGCDRPEPKEVPIEDGVRFEGKDLSEVVEVPVARPVPGAERASGWAEKRASGEPAFAPAKRLFRKPVFEPVDVEALVIYVEGDMLPDAWLQEWARKEGLLVVQRMLPEDGQPPRDGDVLLASPARIAEWSKRGMLRGLTPGEHLSGVAPAFLGHAFDPENRWSRPVRWTPFLLVSAEEKAAVFQGMSLEQLMRDERTVWPDDVALLAALRLKDQGASANTRRVSRQRQAAREVMAWTEGRRVGPGEGWRRVGSGAAEVTYARAAGRALTPGVEAVAWWFPAGGTMVALQVAAVPEFSDRAEAAERLIGFVLGAEQQERLEAETGYFPVRLRDFEGLAVGGKRLPVSKGWLDRAEFLWREVER